MEKPYYQYFPEEKKSNSKTKWIVLSLLVLSLLYAPFKWGINSRSSSLEVADVPDYSLDPVTVGWDEIRLPTFAEPVAYYLTVNTDLENFKFSGNVKIYVSISEPTNFLVLNMVDLNLIDIYVEKGGERLVPSFIHVNAQLEQVYFEFEKLLEKGEWVLAVGYHGILTDSLRGFYKSSFKSHSTTKYIATTQFESTDARRAFPCFDEPELKAVFNIELIVPKNHHGLSNMPIKQVLELENGQKRFIFNPTLRMSTYLVAFIVSDFESIQGKTNRGTLVSIYTQPGETYLGEYKYGITYPISKVDLIAIPDFAAGAMENWSLITFRDTALLFDPKRSSASDKQRVATVIAHELAHQWFGNLVTMKWWSDLWLNEGFAEFMEYKATDGAEPKWEILNQFLFSDVRRALHADGSALTHPIAIPVKNPAEISEIFDDISYGKGSSILRMLEFYLEQVSGSSDYFFSKLTSYLNRYAFGNAETTQLWDALDPQGNLQVSSFMSTWTNQKGHPVVIIEHVSGDQYTLRQERYFYGGLLNARQWKEMGINETSGGSSTSANLDDIFHNNQTWYIPFTFQVGSETKTLVLQSKDKVQVEAKDLLIGNKHHSGVFYTLYPPNLWQNIVNLLLHNPDTFSVPDRAGFIIDAFALSWAGRLAAVELLKLTQFLKNETSMIVWKTAIIELNSLERAFSLHSSYGQYQKYQKTLMQKTSDLIGWKETNNDENDIYRHSRGLMRSEILSEMIAVGDQSTINTALKYFKDLKSGKKLDLTPDVYNVVLDTGVMYGDEDDYMFVVNQFKNTTFAPDQKRLLHAIASCRQPYLQFRTLSSTLTGSVRKQDVTWLINQVANLGGPTGPVMVWHFFRNHWTDFINFWESSGFKQLNELVADIVAKFRQASLVEDAERLFIYQTDKEWFVPPRADVAVRRGLEKAKTRIAWVKKYGDQVEEWLSKINTSGF